MAIWVEVCCYCGWCEYLVVAALKVADIAVERPVPEKIPKV